MAATRLPFWAYALGSLSYSIKICLYVYLGCSVEKVLQEHENTTKEYFIFAIEILIIVISSIVISHVAKAALEKKTLQNDVQLSELQ